MQNLCLGRPRSINSAWCKFVSLPPLAQTLSIHSHSCFSDFCLYTFEKLSSFLECNTPYHKSHIIHHIQKTETCWDIYIYFRKRSYPSWLLHLKVYLKLPNWHFQSLVEGSKHHSKEVTFPKSTYSETQVSWLYTRLLPCGVNGWAQNVLHFSSLWVFS